MALAKPGWSSPNPQIGNYRYLICVPSQNMLLFSVLCSSSPRCNLFVFVLVRIITCERKWPWWACSQTPFRCACKIISNNKLSSSASNEWFQTLGGGVEELELCKCVELFAKYLINQTCTGCRIPVDYKGFGVSASECRARLHAHVPQRPVASCRRLLVGHGLRYSWLPHTQQRKSLRVAFVGQAHSRG